MPAPTLGNRDQTLQVLGLVFGIPLLAAGLDALLVTGANLGDHGNHLIYDGLPLAEVAAAILAPALSRPRLRAAVIVIWVLNVINIVLGLTGAYGY